MRFSQDINTEVRFYIFSHKNQDQRRIFWPFSYQSPNAYANKAVILPFNHRADGA